VRGLLSSLRMTPSALVAFTVLVKAPSMVASRGARHGLLYVKHLTVNVRVARVNVARVAAVPAIYVV
jgi:hypothetical protein